MWYLVPLYQAVRSSRRLVAGMLRPRLAVFLHGTDGLLRCSLPGTPLAIAPAIIQSGRPVVRALYAHIPPIVEALYGIACT